MDDDFVPDGCGRCLDCALWRAAVERLIAEVEEHLRVEAEEYDRWLDHL